MGKRRILFIINPISGVGKQKVVEKYASRYIDSAENELEFAYTSAPNHATELARDAAATHEVVVAVGGDGTIHEVAEGLLYSDCAMGIIPTGSGNGFARCLRIPTSVVKAIKSINNSVATPVDVVRCNQDIFVNVAGIGFDAEIGHLFANTRKRGIFSYVKLIAREFMRYKPITIEVEYEGQTRSFDAFLLSLANSTQWGNNAKIAPLARVNDGLVDICVLRKFPIVASPMMLVKLFAGTFHTSRYMETFQVERATIRTRQSPQKIHLDGESAVAHEGCLSIEVKKNALKVLVPR